MITLKEGEKAPDFELEDQDGKKARLSDFKSRKIILYFYPKDDTPGCTREACALRDNISELSNADAVVLGVSNDDVASHKKFTEKYGLNFRLLADVGKKVSKEYGVYELKNSYGKEYYGITRSTFIIDEEGKIKKIFYKINPDENFGKVMQELKE